MTQFAQNLPAWEQEFRDIVSLLQRFAFLPQESWSCFDPGYDELHLGKRIDGMHLAERRIRAEWRKGDVVLQVTLRRWRDQYESVDERDMSDRFRAKWEPAGLRIFRKSPISDSFTQLWLIDDDLRYVLEALRRADR